MCIQTLCSLLVILLIEKSCIILVEAEARCPAHWIQIGQNCYRTRYNYAVKNWTDGRFWCQTQDADLAKFETIQEQEEVRNYQGLLAASTAFWIGLKRVNDDWTWADNSRVHYDIKNSINRAIIPGHDCGHLSAEDLRSGDCTTARGVLCQQPAGKQIRCDVLQDWQSYGDKCYYRPSEVTSWKKARDICRGKNSTMATPSTNNEQFALFDFIKNNAKKLWIGFHSIRQQNSFKWFASDDTTPIPLAFWENESAVLSSTESQNMCVYMDNQANDWNKSWRSASCDITSGGVICEKAADIVSYNLKYYNTPKTWFDASATCVSHNGQLASRNETYLFDNNAWFGGPGLNLTVTTTRAPTGDDFELDDIKLGVYYDLCPCVTDTGFVYLSCQEKRTFVCNTTSTLVTSDISTTKPAVVAIAVLLVIFAVVLVLFVVIWMRRRKKKDKPIRFNGAAKSNGITIPNMDNKLETREISDNGRKSRPDSTYDHTTTTVKPMTETNTNQNVYDHCVQRQDSTYDHTVRDNHLSPPPADYGCVDDGQYKTINKDGCHGDRDERSNYNHM